MFIKSIVGLSIVALAVAETATTANSTIDPTTVSPSLRSQWCSGEINSCGTLCSGDIDTNSCDTTTLDYNCTCSNGTAPGLQYYTETMPTFICQTIFENCITAGENDAAAQKLCTEAKDKNCGTLSPDNYTAASTSSVSSSTASSTATSSATATSASASAATSKAAASALNIGREYGTGILAAGVAGVFGLLL
ncbi:hypothetical protein NHQ30_006985 [Ciborinia camelliae]|nr:hypothetical protein NHQ30_006985 [Ciborinia camelliae]